MQEGKHTPTPWEYEKLPKEPAYRITCGPWAIARVHSCCGANDSRQTTVGDMTESEANAEFIVKACNSYEKQQEVIEGLVTALTAIKIRIAYIGMPSEPKDWAKECALLEAALAAAKELSYD